MTRFFTRLIIIVVAFLLVFYAGYQALRYVFSPIKTQTALTYVVKDEMPIEGIFIRDEKVLGDANGVLSYSLEQGSKVEKGGVVAQVYASENDALIQKQVVQIDRELTMLNESSDQGTIVTANPDIMKRQISKKVIEIATAVDECRAMDVEEIIYSYMTLTNRRQLVIGRAESFTERVTQLTNLKTNLLKGVTKSPKNIISPVPGFFVNEVDGYEAVLNNQFLNNITIDSFENIYKDKTMQSSKNASGKVIQGYEWSLVASIPFEYNEKIIKGNTAVLNIPFSGASGVAVTISDIKIDKATKKCIVILKSSLMNGELASIRKIKGQLEIKNYTGIRISTKAIRVIDNQKGVYVVIGKEIAFKRIEILYDGKDFYLCNLNSNDSKFIQRYDEVVIEGKDLYDGKPIKF